MIYRLELLLRKTRRRLSRSEWAIRLLGLPKSTRTETSPGLVMIQIDGLSNNQFQRALDSGRMPFLRHLIEKEDYRRFSLYSGIPSSTPAVQGELFYGVQGAVPAFSYVERSSRRIFRMFDREAASAVEQELEKRGEPLLKDGSAYADIYTGGAAETHFVPSDMGWSDLIKTANPFAFAVILISNSMSIVRTLALMAVETVLAVVDSVRGSISGYNLWKEIMFIPTRAGICILLRELVTIGAKIDSARGLPIIHLNLLGYDEQAHRRGPSSRFAHWTLKGIDDSIKRVWRAARASARRDYTIWVYSDHGQEHTIPYPTHAGRTIQEAVADVFDSAERESYFQEEQGQRAEAQRAELLGGRWLQKLFPLAGREKAQPRQSDLIVTSMGPLGHIYPPNGLGQGEIGTLAGRLVRDAKVPLVMAAYGPGEARAWTAEGKFLLPEDSAKVLGSDHPFEKEVARDLVTACHHPDAGPLVISGWRLGKTPISFAVENGSHAGPGPEETGAFALLPPDTPLEEPAADFLRPIDLRGAALKVLGRVDREVVYSRRRRQAESTRRVRVMTYNVHSCLGMDGKLSPERIARLIERYEPDVVALQELDVRRSRTGFVDQAEEIAHALDMKHHFHPAVHMEEEQYGDAILSPHPMQLVRAAKLPGLARRPRLEPRGALWVTIELEQGPIEFFTTHLSLVGRERLLQVEALVGSDWLKHPECRSPTILCGDLNALPNSPTCRKVAMHLRDAQEELENHRPRNTWFGRFPFGRIDHVFVDPDIAVVGVEVPTNELARVASDHLPLIVDFHLPSRHS